MNNKLEQYNQIFEELKQPLKWKVTDKRILMIIASIYVLNQKSLQIDRLLTLSEQIKQKASLFSPLRSYSRYTTAAMLDVKFDHPKEKIHALFDLYDLFRKARFSSGTYTYIAASIVLASESKDSEDIIQKAKDIYDGMKREHSFLTSSSDYPLATLLAVENKPDIINHIEAFYEGLSRNGFRKGNDLQFLSHILALDKETNKNILINRVMNVMESFKTTQLKAKTTFYPIMGMLSLLPEEEYNVNQIVSMVEEMNQQKDFKWQKEMNVIIATSLFVNEKIENNQLTEASLSTILEAILQAQQAVMIATMTAAAATSANSSN